MRKITILFLILFISFIYPASSLKIFEINETDKLSLAPKVEDPDADMLIYTFTDPLDENGEWQTTYGDAGNYTTTISVSDGVTEVKEDILVIVNRKEAEPIINSFLPQEGLVVIDEGKDIKFSVNASDPNNDELTYKWLLNNEVASDNNEMLLETGYNDSGEYIVKVVVSDGVFAVSNEWGVNVNNVDLDDILGQIEDVTVLETETASLELPDFKKYGLRYSISEPIGNNNKWKTTYDDAGEYTVTVTVEGKDFKGEGMVKVIVKNKDRAPKFTGLRGATINENEQLKIELAAVDPDNDKIILSAGDVPENAKLEGDMFIWIPSYDFVQKNTAFDYVLDKLGLLRSSINVVFTAQSNELSDSKNVKITVKDSNRPFVLEDIEDIEANEGDGILIEPRYNDPDKDRVSFSYSGFMDSNKKKLGFDDSGAYIVKVVATDGYFTETKFVNVKVNNVNRKPVFGMIENFEVKEGDEIRIGLSASDPDNDAVSFSAENLPKGAKLMGNVFVWKPGLDAVNGTRKEFSADFIASDENNESVTQKVKITVLNVNQAPEIIDASDNLIALKDEPILFEVNAVDYDGDKLTYSWSFGFFDKFEDGNAHQRIFTTTGKKKVEVTISDGIETVSKVWNVEVV